MPSYTLLLALAVLVTVDAQDSATDAVSTCCQEREVLGTNTKSGFYVLSGENDLRCPDGCLYQKEDSNATSFCFQPTAQQVTACKDDESVDISAIWSVQINMALKSVTMRGEWGPDEFCPVGSYATSFQLYLAPLCTRRCNLDDDVGLMGTKLICAAYNDTTTAVAEVTSSVTDDFARVGGGKSLGYAWKTLHACPANFFLSSARYLSELFVLDDGTGETSNFTCPEGVICGTLTGSTSTSSVDPAGGLNVDMKCSDPGVTILEGDGIGQDERSDNSFWSVWENCAPGFAICGIRSKIHQGETDKKSNLGQTEIMLHCCQLPTGFGI